MKTFTDLRTALRDQAALRPGAEVLLAHARAPLTIDGLCALIDHAGGVLRGAGLAAGDRVAIVLPAGAEMATACLSVMSHCVAVPMNPDYRLAELTASLRRASARAVIARAGGDHPVRDAARALGLPLFELSPQPQDAAGSFSLGAPAVGVSAAQAAADAGEAPLSLILQTSGTTSLPKIVPLTHANLLDSAARLARSLALGPQDRVLNFLPMFHIGGLLDVLIAPLLVGGTVVVQGSFSVPEFYRDLREFRPTWTQAVPVMIQEILGAADDHAEVVRGHDLRFMRSVSAPLPVP